MFRRLIARIDSLGDRINPITVRDLRRCITTNFLERFLVLALLLAATTFVTALAAIDDYPILWELIDVAPMGREKLAWYLAVLPLVVVGYAMIIPAVLSGNGLTKSQLEDELLGLIPLTPRQQVHGYLATSLMMTLFTISIFMPIIAASYLVGRAPYWPLAALGGIFLVFQLFFVAGLSFSVRLKKKWEGFLLGISIYLLIYIVAIPWFGAMILLDSYFHKLEPDWSRGFGFFTLWGFPPLVASVFAYIAYRLSIYHFQRRKNPLWRAILLNGVLYTSASLLLAVVYTVLAIVFL